MDILIDGYNLLKASAGFLFFPSNDLAEQRQLLLDILASYAAARKHRIKVIFDSKITGLSHPRTFQQGTVTVHFCGPNRSADQKILEMATGSGGVVVTSDNEIRQGVRKTGWDEISSEEFLMVLERSLAGEAGDEETKKTGKGPSKKLAKKLRKRKQILDRL